MSTDRQDLSPLIQKEAIAKFALANDFEIVSSYEDAGKSGVHLANRPRLRQLLLDVTKGAPFTEILVYDVSRWGRFQDVDAAAYYEYHCRMHGVQVVYVSESFSNDHTPASVLLKSLRRVMAAEYSRDIAWKSRAGQERVVAMGYHMGALPPLGYRRCSVSADGTRRLMLRHGQAKAAFTDRVQWVLASEAEVGLVRRICSAYVNGLEVEEIVNLVNAEGWHTEEGHAISTQSLRSLLRNEALIGNFVWGMYSKGGKIIACAPSRFNGSVPRIIDDETWSAIQAKLKADPRSRAQRKDPADAQSDRSSQRRSVQLWLNFGLDVTPKGFKNTLGTPMELRAHPKEFGLALRARVEDVGVPVTFDTRTHVLSFWRARVRIRLMWPCAPEAWLLGRSRFGREGEQVLVARMAGLYCPLDFFVLPSKAEERLLMRLLDRDVPRDLLPYWCRCPDELIECLLKIAASPCRAQEEMRTERASNEQRSISEEFHANNTCRADPGEVHVQSAQKPCGKKVP
jgi:DNA invertase Pin-like site-specific DNA recombinase